MVTVLNLANGSSHIMDFPKKRVKFSPKEQDPMSHRIIEKRRRDRMNNCLADLSRLIPPDYLKKGRGRIEKTEIIEMAIKHLKYLQERANCTEQRENGRISVENFRLGYQECLSEVMRYLFEGQSHFPRDAVCVQLINHLQRHCDNIIKGDALNKPRCNNDSNSSSSGSSSNYMTHNQLNTSNSVQRLKGKQLDMNSNERHHQHSNMYAEKSGMSMNNIDIHAPERNDKSSEETLNEAQDIYSEQNMSSSPSTNDNTYSGLKLGEGNVDEGGGQSRTEFLQKMLPDMSNNIENECQSVQDLRLQYSTISPTYHYSHRGHNEQNLRNIRKGYLSQPGDSGHGSMQGDIDNVHSYKFKNNIKQRFSQSQSTDYMSSSDGMTNVNSCNRNDHIFTRRDQYLVNSKLLHKKRKLANDHQSRHANNLYDNNQYKDQMSSSETNSSENITNMYQNPTYRSKKLPETDSVSTVGVPTDNEYLKLSQHATPNARHGKLYNNHPENVADSFLKSQGIGVPIFALHAKGSFYVPMNVDYECLVPFLGPYNLLDATSFQPNISLHPVTISVNFQPMFFSNKQMAIRTKSEKQDWQ